MRFDPTEFGELLARVREKDQDACRVLYERYGEPLRYVIRRHLDRRLWSLYDSIDFLQDVMAAVFEGAVKEPASATSEQFLKLLACIARNKVLDAHRKHLDTQKSLLAHRSYLEETPGKESLASRAHSPERLASAREDWEKLLERVGPRQREVLKLYRDGYAQREIAGRTGIHEKTVGRFLQSLGLRAPDVRKT